MDSQLAQKVLLYKGALDNKIHKEDATDYLFPGASKPMEYQKIYPWAKFYFLQAKIYTKLANLSPEAYANAIINGLKNKDQVLLNAFKGLDTDNDKTKKEAEAEAEEKKRIEESKKREENKKRSDLLDTVQKPDKKLTPEETVEVLKNAYVEPEVPLDPIQAAAKHLEKVASENTPTTKTPVQEATERLESIAKTTTPEQAAEYLKALSESIEPEPQVIITPTPSITITRTTTIPTMVTQRQDSSSPYQPQIQNQPRRGIPTPPKVPSAARGLLRGGGGRLVAGTAARAALLSPAAWPFWVILVVVIIVVIILLVIIMGLSQQNAQLGLPGQGTITDNPEPIVDSRARISKTGPVSIQNGENITYQITVTYLGNGRGNIEVTDALPAKTEFIDAPGGNFTKPRNEDEGGIVKWNITGLSSNQSRVLSLTIKPNTPDIWVQNTASFKVTDSSEISGGGEAPSSSNCGGKYKLDNPVGNFGDPSCNFNKEDLYTLLKQLDPVDADFWFYTVVRHESTYNPNAFADPIRVGTPDKVGAWGLFQMGRGKNGQYDHGDVPWQNQTRNAVTYNNDLKNRGLAWRYWQAAKSRW